MSSPAGPATPEQGGDDPWAAFGYLVAGVLFYGAIGFGLSKWLHAVFWIPVGILVGAAFGLYMIFARYSLEAKKIASSAVNIDKTSHSTPNISSDDEATSHNEAESPDEAARNTRPDNIDRGETA